MIFKYNSRAKGDVVMKSLTNLKLPDGLEILVESEIPEHASGLAPAARADHAEEAEKTIEEILPAVQALCRSIIGTLTSDPVRPDTIALEFGVKIGGSAGVIIASGTAEANIKLSLTWQGK